MFAHRPSAYAHAPADTSPLVTEEQRQRKANYAKKTEQNLIGVGLLNGAATDSRHGHRTKKRKKSAFKLEIQEINPWPVPAQEAHHSSANPDTSLPRATQQTPLPSTTHQRSSSVKSPLKELHSEAMFAAKGSSRRERTFVGSICAACDEPLEHMLRGERVLQLSCGHVSHEACFYEYIQEFEAQTCPQCEKPLALDPSRGGNLDLENLNKLVRNVQTPDPREQLRDVASTPVSSTPSWESQTARQSSILASQAHSRESRDHLLPRAPSSSSQHDRHAPSHVRQVSGETGEASSHGFSEVPLLRKHDYDVQSMEACVKSPILRPSNPIPAPNVTVRSEFPTLNKSKHQQSLTCLVTVEVLEGKWHPDPDDVRSPTAGVPPIPEESREQSPAQPPIRLPRPVDSVHEDMALEETREELFQRVENWHGLDVERFGKLILHGVMRVGKDRQSWQELECYLFTEMLICVKEKKVLSNTSQRWDGPAEPKSKTHCTLKGSILIKRHLHHVETSYEDDILTLSLSVQELPAFHLHFRERRQLELWRRALINIHMPRPPTPPRNEFDQDVYSPGESGHLSKQTQRLSSPHSSSDGPPRSLGTAPTEYNSRTGAKDMRLGTSSMHIPLDIVVVIPVSASMHGLKMDLLRDTLRFLVSSLGERDRMGLVTFGSPIGGAPLIGMTTKTWPGWAGALDSIRPAHQKTQRADVVEGANVAMDLLMQRKSSNPLSHIILISDSPTSEPESVDFVVSRAEAAKISIHSFGLGLSHKPDTMVEMATRTKASYTYVKDWMMLRECLAGCMGALQSISHQNVKLHLRLPEGSPAKLVKVNGALQVTKRATGRDAEVSLGDLRFGDKRDILVQLAIQPESSAPESIPSDPWENIISGLEALGTMDQDQQTISIEEAPLLQADLAWGDILRDGTVTQLPRPSLLAITMLPPSVKKPSYGRPSTPLIPPHPSIVQRRMELLTSDMLSRALGLVARGQNDRAEHLLTETRSILKGLGKGGLPPLPTPPPSGALPPTPQSSNSRASPLDSLNTPFPQPPGQRTPSPHYQADALTPFSPAAGIDKLTTAALDTELESSLEYISHPAVFARDSRKAILQAISVISSQRGYTFRTPVESLWATRIPGVRRLADRSRDWRETGDESLREEP